MTTIRKVLVVGGTGYLGRIVVEALLASNFIVSILTRSAGQRSPHNVKILLTDYSDASLIEAMQGHDAVISTVGAGAVMQQTKLIDAAITAGVKRFIPSDYAPNTPDLSAMENVVPPLYARLQPRQAILSYLQVKAKNTPTFSWTAIGSCPLFEWSLQTGAQGISLADKTAIITDSGNEPYPSTTAPQIARTITHVLSHPQNTANRYFLVKSFITSQNQVMKVLERATRSKWQMQQISSEQRKTDGLQLLAEGNFAGLGNFWNVWYNTDGRGIDISEQAFANSELHLQDEDIERVVAGLVA